MTEADDDQRPEPEPSRAMVERDRVGAAVRRRSRLPHEELPPISSTELSKGPAELAEDREPRVNWRVFVTSSLVVLAFSVWAMAAPHHAASAMRDVVGWIATNLGWFYVLTVTVVIVFVLWVALSKEGSVRLGPDHSRPQYKLFTWVAMLFAAGVGIAPVNLPAASTTKTSTKVPRISVTVFQIGSRTSGPVENTPSLKPAGASPSNCFL